MNDRDDDDLELDPVFVSSIREMKWILMAWIIGFAWVIGYCVTFGYATDGEPIDTTLGVPSWAFWGVFVPWLFIAVFTSWFALFKMEDHPLEDDELETTDV